MAIGVFAMSDEHRVFDICAGNESQFLNMVGGAALGTSITASVAGHSVVMIVTEGAALIVAAPAIAPALATTAVVGSSAFVFMKSYCSAEIVTDVAADLYQAAKDGTVDTISVVAGTYRVAVQQTSERFEAAEEIHEIAVGQQSKNIEKAAEGLEKTRRWLTDKLCSWDSKCK